MTEETGGREAPRDESDDAFEELPPLDSLDGDEELGVGDSRDPEGPEEARTAGDSGNETVGLDDDAAEDDVLSVDACLELPEESTSSSLAPTPDDAEDEEPTDVAADLFDGLTGARDEEYGWTEGSEAASDGEWETDLPLADESAGTPLDAGELGLDEGEAGDDAGDDDSVSFPPLPEDEEADDEEPELEDLRRWDARGCHP